MTCVHTAPAQALSACRAPARFLVRPQRLTCVSPLLEGRPNAPFHALVQASHRRAYVRRGLDERADAATQVHQRP
jgi:hypothetical protein